MGTSSATICRVFVDRDASTWKGLSLFCLVTSIERGSTYITMKQRCLKYLRKTTYILCLKNTTCTIRPKKCTRILEKYLVKPYTSKLTNTKKHRKAQAQLMHRGPLQRPAIGMQHFSQNSRACQGHQLKAVTELLLVLPEFLVALMVSTECLMLQSTRK